MTQDTRKDRRVKIVSLNVRYKSATVDEFIENHAHDVSKGGIYIKTANPFPPGTLLKFEIRLASDQAVITGVGRVVWKRDAAQASGERPAGMGVKFIKIDDPSKTVIDRLVSSRSDAGRAYEAESEAPPASSQHPPPVTAAAKSASVTPVAGATAANAGAALRKATMVGVGGPTPTPAPPASQGATGAAKRIMSPPPAPPRPGAGGDMFPKASASDSPRPEKQEQTVMKQAAELLEEALREAGGSMEEVGTNPLFSGGAAPAAAAPSPPAEAPVAAEEVSPPKPTDDAEKARVMAAGLSPAPAPEKNAEKKVTDPPRTARETPSSRDDGRGRPTAARVSSKPPAARAADALAAQQKAQEKAKGSGGAVIVMVAVAAAAVVGVLYRDKLFGGGPTEVPTHEGAPVAASVPPTTTETASASAAASEAASASPTPSASVAATASAGPNASAASTNASASASATKPVVSAAPTAAPKAPTPTATAAVPATPTPTAIASAPPAAMTASAAATATAPPAPVHTAAPPRPKPAAPAAKPADDNPY